MTPWTIACQAPLSMGHGQEYQNGCYFFLQGIFLIQVSNLYLLCVLHWQTDPSPLAPPGKPYLDVDISFHQAAIQPTKVFVKKEN